MKNKRFVLMTVLLAFISLAGYFYIVYVAKINPLLGQINIKAYGAACEYYKKCNGLIGVNCQAEMDGTFFYVDAKTGRIISECGGYCQGGCQNCPPEGWTCSVF